VAAGTWRDEITGRVSTGATGVGLRLDDILDALPVALLVKENA
jgi:hypothetical protein